ARLVHMSTDVVFAGREAPYTEDDPVDPVHDYGRAKADAEREVMAAHPDAVMVRTSLMYGGPDSPPVRMVLDAAAGRADVAFFADEHRSVAHVADIAGAVLALARMDVRGPLHVAGPAPVSRLAFAHAVCRAHGLPENAVRGSILAAAGLDRPGNLVLDSSRAAALGVPMPGPAHRRLRRS
ncbi:MAG: sugar nucleotide-binding protein, partial [Thermoleophilia bacterium]|nr:sugar nucleotide-binding protein [Thermoleophilia bacterium]